MTESRANSTENRDGHSKAQTLNANSSAKLCENPKRTVITEATGFHSR